MFEGVNSDALKQDRIHNYFAFCVFDKKTTNGFRPFKEVNVQVKGLFILRTTAICHLSFFRVNLLSPGEDSIYTV